MSRRSPPPINEVMIDKNGLANIAWLLFFNQSFVGDTGTSWTPTFTNLTTTGTPTITGLYKKVSQSLVYVRILITPATDTSSTAGTTYVNNFPLTLLADGAINATSNNQSITPGAATASTNRLYTPTWAAVTTPITISGLIEAE